MMQGGSVRVRLAAAAVAHGRQADGALDGVAEHNDEPDALAYTVQKRKSWSPQFLLLPQDHFHVQPVPGALKHVQNEPCATFFAV